MVELVVCVMIEFTCICASFDVFGDCAIEMGKCLFEAVELEILLANMEQGLNQSKVGLLVSEHQYLTVSQFFHPERDDGLKGLAVIFSDVLKNLLQFELHIFAED